MNAIMATTRLCNEITGMVECLGQVGPGYLANLWVVDGAPLADVGILQQRDRFRARMKDPAFCRSPHAISHRVEIA